MADRGTWEERMGARARARREVAERAERERADAEYEELMRREQEAYRDVFDAGPPGGCRTCYVWVRDHFGCGWRWVHSEPEGLIELRQVDDPDYPDYGPYDTRICHHDCHGLDGEDIGPVIAFAAAT